MPFSEKTLCDFTVKLSSKDPVPGGGGAASICGAIGASLAVMVGNLTVGKKKYVAVEADILKIMEQCNALREDFLKLIDDDAKAFEPLSKAYSLPKTTEEEIEFKDSVMEKALLEASLVPIEIMEKCCETISLLSKLVANCSPLAISDVGVGAACCKAALIGASLNVYINTSLMKNKEEAVRLNQKADSMIEIHSQMADETFADVLAKIRK